MKSKSKALHKIKMGEARKKMKEGGYTTKPEKSYYEYNTRERANIRENSKPNSNMKQWMGNKAARGHQTPWDKI